MATPSNSALEQTTRRHRDVASALPAPDAVIRVRRLDKVFDNGVTALEGVDLSIAADEFVSIVGLSGCGKSTLLRIIAGLTPATRGSVELLGKPVAGPGREVGLMFQRPALLDWKTALENVLLPVGLHRRVANDDIREAMRLLELFGLGGFEHQFPQQLSGGMQQRAALARLLMTGAQVRLLDEPFAAVDELTREHLNLELLKIHEETASTTVLITHNIYEAVLLSDRIVVMSPRPGTIAASIDVPLPRPRSLDNVLTPEFQAIALAARNSLLPSGSMGGARVNT